MVRVLNPLMRACAVCAVLFQGPAAVAQLADDNTSLVWIAGTVTGIHTGQAEFDLGDVHALTFGQSVAVFRSVDDHYEPVGVLEIEATGPTSSVARRTRTVPVQAGDRVLTCRTLRQLGPSDEFRDDFLKRQLLTRGDRNRYSNFLAGEEAATLHRYSRRQPKWFRDSQPVAGMIRSVSISENELQDLQPLLSQILLIQEYELDGVPVDQALSLQWNLVLAALDVRNRDLFTAAGATVDPVVASDVEPAAEPATAEPGSEEPPVRVDAIRRLVNERMFDRPREQRQLAVLLGTALETLEPRYEDIWLGQQLAKTQFPSVADEAEWLRDFRNVMERVRQEQQ
jgi:hypothetical protein